jgi:transcriptional regulator with XRE-family HTH domain
MKKHRARATPVDASRTWRSSALKKVENAAHSTESPLLQLLEAVGGLATDMGTTARKFATRAMTPTPERLRAMAAAGESLRDIRQVAGLTAAEISEALNLRDKSVWEAVESGREVLSFERILRLASLLARNDPLPFVLQYTRTYAPAVWKILHQLKIDTLPLQLEREHAFVNIYRGNDAARKLSDSEFEHILAFTRQAFDLAMHFAVKPEDKPAHDDKRARARKNGSRRTR